MMSRTHSMVRRFPRRPARRRGVASVLAMMFLVIFGSLAAVMAVVAQSNLRTADSYLKVTRATSQAEMGLVFAKRRLAEAARRFVVTKGVVTDDFGEKLWLGTYTSQDGTVTVLPPTFDEGSSPLGLAEAIRNAHLADEHHIEVEPGDALLPSIDEFGTLRVQPIGTIESDVVGPHFRLKYELLADGRYVRVTSQGVDGDVRRTLQMDFQIVKKIEYAVISPNRIMIGKNVRIEGPLGSRYGIMNGELTPQNGNPLVMRSDFYHLHPDLNTLLNDFFAGVSEFDVDGDGRLRPNHVTEANGLTEQMPDYDGDEYVDDFDLFLAHFDANSDGMVVWDKDLAASHGLSGLTNEFTLDDQLAKLIDNANPDRNGDGVVDALDHALGYANGVIDRNDSYAKVRGRLAFAVSKSDWEGARNASYQTMVHGPIVTDPDQAPVTFEVSEADLLNITTADFEETETWLVDKAQSGASFADQVASNLGTGGLYTAESDAPWETVPWGAKGYYDWYRRPIYENMTFQNVVIPMGNNGLFKNCTFIGAVYIETHTDNGDVNWNYAGMVDRSGGDMAPKYPGLTADYNGTPVDDTRPYSNNIRFHDCRFAGSIVAKATTQYTHVRNKIQFTGDTVFTLENENLTEEEIEELAKSSILMPGYSVDVGHFTNSSLVPVQLKGTIIAGVMDVRGSADIFGTLLMTFRAVEGEGPLHYGGTPDAFNTTIGYFGPDDGDAESVDPSTLSDTDGDGFPDIGVDLDGDGFNDPFLGFGEITIRYNPDGKLPDGIPWPITIEAVEGTYVEGGSL